MTIIRMLHLYLGCVFAPILLLLAGTGIVQMLFPAYAGGLSTRFFGLHTARAMKDGTEWTGLAWRWFVAAMAASLMLSVVLGLVMAFRHAKRPVTILACLLTGIAVPVVLILAKIAG